MIPIHPAASFAVTVLLLRHVRVVGGQADCKHLTTDPNTCWSFEDDASVTWQQASSACSAAGGRIPVEPDSTVRAALIREMTKRTNVDHWWVGLESVDEADAKYQWLDGHLIFLS